MKISLERIGAPYHFEARNEAGNAIAIDTAPKSGGTGQGPSPMQLVAMGLAGCSSIDVVSILEKQRLEITSFAVEVDAERATDQVPAVFTKLHLHFRLAGDLDPAKVRRAIELSIEKYCSVSRMLEKTATISYSYEVNGERHDGA